MIRFRLNKVKADKTGISLFDSDSCIDRIDLSPLSTVKSPNGKRFKYGAL